MLAPLEVPRRCVVARPYNSQRLQSRLGWAWVSQHFGNSRGFPTDFPVVGLIGEMVGPNRTSGSLPIADFTVILLDAALAVGKREPRGLVRCTPFHAMCATRGEL